MRERAPRRLDLALALAAILALQSCRLLLPPRPPHSAATRFAAIYANTPALATSAAERLTRLRESVLSLLPHASETATYTVTFHDPEVYERSARVRSTAHAHGFIVKHPFKEHSWITVPEAVADDVLAHELTHALRSSFWRPLTRYMEEGVAEYVADEVDPSRDYLAESVVFLAISRGLAGDEAHTLVFLYPDGTHHTESSERSSSRPAPTFDPFSVLAAPNGLFDTPRERAVLPQAYAAAAIVMRRAILNGDEPFAALARLCEEARATRAGILDVADVFELAGFPDRESFDRFVEESYEEAWLDAVFSTSDILELVMEIEAIHERQFDRPETLFEVTDLRYIRGAHSFSIPEDRELDDPRFRAHVIQNWPSAEQLRQARAGAATTSP